MKLPEAVEKQFQLELKAFEEAKQMKYVTTIERMAKEEERVATQTAIALNFLRQGLAVEVISQGTGLTVEQVQALQAQAPQIPVEDPKR
jgi:FKBP-type peptidyl-prolyl cis-trans isomerase